MSDPNPTSTRATSSSVDVYDGPTTDDGVSVGATARDVAGPRVRFRARAWGLPLVLFLATCVSTFFAGAMAWNPQLLLEQAGKAAVDAAVDIPVTPLDEFDRFQPVRVILAGGVERGLWYAGFVLLILITHEMGHFLTSAWYRVPTSLPLVIPLPLLSPIGTLGAVILTDPRRIDRKAMFDIGIAGPLAGLVVCVPILIYGLANVDFAKGGAGPSVELPLLARGILDWLRPSGYLRQTSVHLDQLNPALMAGWVGFLVTGLNMMPVSQLDGGHVVHGLFGRDARWIARGFMVCAALACAAFGLYHWFLMMALVVFIGVDHPPTSDDRVPLGAVRIVLGALSLAIPVLCFPPRVMID